jgi:carbon-monoxide dehydrogenase medium subunit
MSPFTYHRPTSVDQAVALLAANADGKLLAGGQSLLPTLRLRLAAPTDLIDLRHINELRGIRVSGNELLVGAMSSHCDVATSVEIRRLIPALAALAGGIGDRQVRNLGTLGGSLANNDPAACYPAALLALNATVHTSQRRVPADEFLRGLYETCLAPDELITAVSFPVPKRAAYLKFRQPASRFARAGGFVAELRGGCRVAVTGAGLRGAFRVPEIEAALLRSFSVESLARCRIDPVALASDLHASAAYRAHLIVVMARRAVAQLNSTAAR